MSRNLLKNRAQAFKRQDGRCFYCSAEMWLGSPGDFMDRHKLSKRGAARFQCTAEHLTARQDGGNDSKGNIVAACLFAIGNGMQGRFLCQSNHTSNLSSGD